MPIEGPIFFGGSSEGRAGWLVAPAAIWRRRVRRSGNRLEGRNATRHTGQDIENAASRWLAFPI
jgi:hypothetical protein